MAKKQVVEVEKSMIEKITSSKSHSDLSRVLSKFLGQTVYARLTVEKDRHEKDYVKFQSDPIPVQTMGIARFLFKTFILSSFNRIWNIDADTPWFMLHASYEHPRNGSNGHELFAGDMEIKVEFDPSDETWAVVMGR